MEWSKFKFKSFQVGTDRTPKYLLQQQIQTKLLVFPKSSKVRRAEKCIIYIYIYDVKTFKRSSKTAQVTPKCAIPTVDGRNPTARGNQLYYKLV